MKTWFCITSAIDDSVRTTAAAVTAARTAERRPESGVTIGERENVYTDWFDGLEQAKSFIRERAKAAQDGPSSPMCLMENGRIFAYTLPTKARKNGCESL